MAHLWYSIQTYAGSERSVKAAIENIIAENHLEEVITEVIVPTEDVIEVKNGKKKITERSLYSGYVFANIDLSVDLQHRIQSLP
ncbi:MAG TPA: transcription termination/antitermination NusG family protein, partial [Sulfuricurvum sp.]|nr:transcription termination/antitermination NusG family protein [Sulfuricurvum sp.]